MRPVCLCLAFLLLAVPARAETPRVAVDVAPVHALVSQVMAGVGAPDLIVPPGASPHGYAMRPSQARALQDADLVVWIGEGLTPWLGKPIATLAADAAQLELLEAPQTILHAYRQGAEQGHDSHAPDEDGHDDHAGADPHAWLDPENGILWLMLIADALAAADPENAARYHDNAANSSAALDALSAEIAQILAPVKGRSFFTFHDAYQYFEARFGLRSAGAVSLGDATDPSPARLAALRDQIAEGNVTCAFSEPQFDDRLLRAVSDATDLSIGMLDPMGSTLTPGPGLYAALLRNMAQSFAACGKP